jgi:hypothetical protein
MQHFLKFAPGAAWTEVISSQLFAQFFCPAANCPETPFYAAFRRESRAGACCWKGTLADLQL